MMEKSRLYIHERRERRKGEEGRGGEGEEEIEND